jgi:hypothetical protein
VTVIEVLRMKLAFERETGRLATRADVHPVDMESLLAGGGVAAVAVADGVHVLGCSWYIDVTVEPGSVRFSHAA